MATLQIAVRRCSFLLELDPLYCDVIIERWEKFTGRKAHRASATKSRSHRSGRTRKSACRAKA
jgi:DNA modification methylase